MVSTIPSIAYLSQGRLFIKRGDEPAQLIESRFAQDLIDRDLRSRQKNNWKTKSPGWNVRADGGMGGMMGMGAGQGEGDARRIQITAITRCPTPGEFIYALDTDTVGGLFHYTLAGNDERRLVHHHDFRVRDLHRHPTADLVACSVHHEDGSANLAVTAADGGKMREITEGDSVDESPSWAGGGGQRMVFQSAGIGRNQTGYVTGYGPYRIEQLDLERGDMSTLLEDPAHDLLLPRMTADGSLLFIRRPYFLHGLAPTSPMQRLGDLVMFPVRVLQTLAAYLNFTSMIYRGKPLSSAGGPKQEGPDLRQMMLWGRYINAKQAEKLLRNESAGAMVGKEWQLIRRDRGGSETVLARHVLSYDLASDGSIIHTNGGFIFLLAADGGSRKICDASIIERVVAVE